MLVPPGWAFVLYNVRWHLTASAVLLLICWAAVVATGFWAINMAMAAAAEGDEGWFAVRGKREELEREKRGLLKAIKDIEFDRETRQAVQGRRRGVDRVVPGPRHRGDQDHRGRDRRDHVVGDGARAILAEVRARAAIDAKTKGKKSKKSKEQAS